MNHKLIFAVLHISMVTAFYLFFKAHLELVTHVGEKRPLHVENTCFPTCRSILYESEVGADSEGAIVCYALDWCMLFCMWLWLVKSDD